MRTSARDDAAILDAAERLHASLAIARGLVLSGRQVDLAGLDGDATRLCAAVACAGQAAHPALCHALESALREVERLRSALRGQ